MSETARITERLISQLDAAVRLRASARADAASAERRQNLRAWQTVRLARTHADLLASQRFGLAATFFLTELYSAKDISSRDEQVRSVVPVMTRMLPTSALETASDAIELDALSEDL